MHLLNILNQLGATNEEREKIKFHFKDKVVSHRDVVDEFCKLRGVKNTSLVKNNH